MWYSTPPLGRHVEQPADAEGGVGDETGGRGGRLADPQLQHVVHDRERLAQIGQAVVQAPPQEPGRDGEIDLGDRAQDDLVDAAVHRIELAVQALQRVIGPGGRRAGILGHRHAGAQPQTEDDRRDGHGGCDHPTELGRTGRH